MKKFFLSFILMSFPILSIANESLLFSCESEKNNNEFRLIEHADKLEAEYQVVNQKTGDVGFSFVNSVDDIKFTEFTSDNGTPIKALVLSNNGYHYVMARVKHNDEYISLGVFATDPNGKQISENFCKGVRELVNANDGKQIQSSQKSILEEGMYRVGKDIPAGEYKLTATSEFGGSFKITKDSRHTLESIIAIDNFQKTTFITVKDGQYLELKRCIAEMEQ